MNLATNILNQSIQRAQYLGREIDSIVLCEPLWRVLMRSVDNSSEVEDSTTYNGVTVLLGETDFVTVNYINE